MIRKRFLKGVLLAVCMGFKSCMYLQASTFVAQGSTFGLLPVSPAVQHQFIAEFIEENNKDAMSNPCQAPIKTFKTVITWCQLCQHFLYEHALRIQEGLAKDCKHFISLYSFNRISLKASINPNLQQLSTFFIVTLSTVKRAGLWFGTSYFCISIQKHTKKT